VCFPSSSWSTGSVTKWKVSVDSALMVPAQPIVRQNIKTSLKTRLIMFRRRPKLGLEVGSLSMNAITIDFDTGHWRQYGLTKGLSNKEKMLKYLIQIVVRMRLDTKCSVSRRLIAQCLAEIMHYRH
jgi:hypothetical protein